MTGYSPFLIEAKYQPRNVSVSFSPRVIEANQSKLIIEYQVNERFQRIPITSHGQTVFGLSHSPSVPANVKVYLVPEGVFVSGIYYSISGATLTFLPTFPVTLEVSEYLDIYYY